MGDLDEKQLQDRDEEIKLVSGLDSSILLKQGCSALSCCVFVTGKIGPMSLESRLDTSILKQRNKRVKEVLP